MIIKKKVNKEKEKAQNAQQDAPKKSGKIIKGEELKKKVNPLKKRALEKKEKEKEKIEAMMGMPPDIEDKKEPVIEKSPLELKLEEFEKIDVSIIEFKERFERRRGERRRGFRRIDERTLISRAQEEAQSIREIAAKEGYKNGLLEAQNEIDILNSSLKEFMNFKNEIYEEMSSHVLEISLAIAKKIIKKEVELSNDVLKAVMGEVFSELSNTDEKITVKVNPDDVEFARVSIPEILDDTQTDAKINVIGDEYIEKGSCTVMASNGVIDANFTTQLAIIQNAFGIYKGGE